MRHVDERHAAAQRGSAPSTQTDTGAEQRGAQPVRARRTVTLPPAPSSPGRARHVVRQVLVQEGRQDCLDAAELACTELVTNAVLHAHTPIEVTVEVAGRVWVGVSDGSPSLPHRHRYDTHATTGRGLALVAALTDEHGITDAGRGGKTVWFTVGGRPRDRSEDELLMAWAAADWDLDATAAPAVPVGTTRTVRLLALPAALWLAARQHHDALLRELALYVARNDDVQVDAVATDRARFTLSGAVAAAVETQRRVVSAQPSAADRGDLPWAPGPIDLCLEIPVGMARDFAAMQETLDTAERLARAGELLAHPGLPEIVAVRDWAVDQVVAQLAGIEPSGWPGADQVVGTHGREAYQAGDDVPLGGIGSAGISAFDLATVRDSVRSVAAADGSNRLVAVSAPLARLLGWQVHDLVGRRIVALVPPRLRDAHVAGFTRHQSTGEARVIGTPVTVPVLRADGSEISCRLLIESTVDRGRPIYLAWIDAVEEPA